MRNVPGRLRQVAGRRGIALYDDTYNANPGSVRAAIAFLESLPGERWLVLGDMAELGPDSLAMHREIGEAARPGRHRAPVLRRRAEPGGGGGVRRQRGVARVGAGAGGRRGGGAAAAA